MDKSNTASFEEAEKLIPAQIKQIRIALEVKYKLDIPIGCDKFIARCLRTKDGNAENAIKLIRAFHNTIGNFKYWDVKLMPSAFQHYYETGVIEPMIGRDKNGTRMLIIRTGLWDIQHLSFDQVSAVLWMIAQYGLSELLEVQRNGYVLIWDFSEFTWQHAWAVKHLRLLTLMKWAQNGVGGRFKTLHIVSYPKAVDYIYKAIRPFMSEKLKKRVILHRNIESLLNAVGAQNLPRFIGGSLEREQCIDTYLVHGFLKSDKFFQGDMINVGFPSK